MKKLLSLLCIMTAFWLSTMALSPAYEYQNTHPPVVFADNYDGIEAMDYCFCDACVSCDIEYALMPVTVGVCFSEENVVTVIWMDNDVCILKPGNERQCYYDSQYINFHNRDKEIAFTIYDKIVTFDRCFCLLL